MYMIEIFCAYTFYNYLIKLNPVRLILTPFMHSEGFWDMHSWVKACLHLILVRFMPS